MKKSDFCLITSGTATLECALIGTPFLVLFKTHFLNYLIGKKLIEVPYISLPNIICNSEIVKEFIQDFQTRHVVHYLEQSLSKESLAHMKTKLQSMRSLLKADASLLAAKKIVEMI